MLTCVRPSLSRIRWSSAAHLCSQGEKVYKALLEAGTKRGIKIRVAQSAPSSHTPDQDTADLASAGKNLPVSQNELQKETSLP